MKTIALWLWYRGDGFRGYQSQPRGPTVQDALESALAQLSVRGRPLPAGRTDLGVHARMQVVRIRTEEDGSDEAFMRALRPLLPQGLGVVAAREVPRGFHPQWHAETKEYRYRLCLDGEVATSESSAWAAVWQTPWPVDPARLEKIVQSCVGTRDFSAFHEKSSAIKARTLLRAELRVVGPVDGRTVHELRWLGDGFGRYQVRYLTGSATATAAGALDATAFDSALREAKSIAGMKAPARGLVLWAVSYPPQWDPFTEQDRRAAEAALPPGLPFSSPG